MKTRFAPLAIAAALLLGACGNKGPLVLPDKPKPETPASPLVPVPVPPSDDGKTEQTPPADALPTPPSEVGKPTLPQSPDNNE